MKPYTRWVKTSCLLSIACARQRKTWRSLHDERADKPYYRAVSPEPPDRDAPPPITVTTGYFDGFAMGIYDNARWQISKHQYAAAVLLAQAAVEMGVWNAFTSLLVRRCGPFDDKTFREQVPDLSFMDEGTRRLWTQLTGGHRVTRPKDPPVWKQYVAHVEYRNLIAHGQTWGDAAGFASVVAAGQFILRIDEQMREVDEGDPGFLRSSASPRTIAKRGVQCPSKGKARSPIARCDGSTRKTSWRRRPQGHGTPSAPTPSTTLIAPPGRCRSQGPSTERSRVDPPIRGTPDDTAADGRAPSSAPLDRRNPARGCDSRSRQDCRRSHPLDHAAGCGSRPNPAAAEPRPSRRSEWIEFATVERSH